MNSSVFSRLNGVLLVNKPPNCTSFDVVRKIKPLVRPAKVGHAGTLDPIATGLLPLCLGEATKVVRFLSKHRKRYQALLRLGKSTDTLDRLGATIKEAPVPDLTGQDVQAVLQAFKGKIQQVPPMYSALHHKGKRLYDLARQGIQTERTPRTVNIMSLETLAQGADWIELDIICSAGTYVRSLVSDIATHLGTVGHLAELHRKECSGWTIGEAYQLLELTVLEPEQLRSLLIPVEQAISHMPCFDIPQEIVKRLAMGQKLTPPILSRLGLSTQEQRDPFWLRPPEGNPIVVAQWKPLGSSSHAPQLEILRILNTS